MKKNYLFGLFAMASMLFTTSCQQDNLVPAEADTDLVTFAIKTQDVATRAATGKGSLADNLFYGVYESVDIDGDGTKEWRLIEEANVKEGNKQGISMTKTPHSSFTAENGGLVTLRLARQKEYSIIFWAQSEAKNALCTVDWEKRELKVNNAYANQESYDAFWAYEHIKSFSGAQKKEVTLTRPFAQVNIGVKNDDLEAANLASVDLENSAVTVKKVPTTMSLVDGTVSGLTETSAVAYASAAIPAASEWEFPVAGNTYLALNYVLVGTEQSLVDIDLSYTDTEGGNYSYAFTNIPVQRNYRTNIYGNILTASEDYDVDINPGFGGNVTDGETIFDIPGLQAAIDAAPVGQTTTIYLGADLEGDVMEHQKADRHVIIEGRGHKYNGTFKIHCGSNYNNGSITIKNINFETSTEAKNFIMPYDFGVEDGVTRRYSNNVIVESCTFTATGAAENTAVGVQAKATNNLQVLNCTATGLHSLVQAQSCGTDVIVKKATITGKNGVAFKQVKNAVVEASTIDVSAYGIRFDGNIDNYGITVKNNKIEAVQPLIVRKMTGKDNKIALEGTNTLITTIPDVYQIVITNGSDDVDYVTPTGTYTLTGAKGFYVFPEDYATVYVSSSTDLQSLISGGETDNIKFSSAIDMGTNGLNVNGDVTIDMDGKQFKSYGYSNDGFQGYSIYVEDKSKLTIENANMLSEGFYLLNEGNVVFESGKFVCKASTTSRWLFYVAGNSTLTIKDGDFSIHTSQKKVGYIYAYGEGTTVRIEGGNFANVLIDGRAAISTANGGKVIITGGTFGFNPSTWVAAGYKATKTGSTWTVAAK